MRQKIEIFCETGLDDNGYPVRKSIKKFKNEPEALAFYGDQKNVRRYGTMFMNKKTGDGISFSWDDRKEAWVQE